LPDAYILKEGAKIYDLQEPTNKMSKSANSASGVIELMDAPEINTKKIKSAVTDTGREVLFDYENKPGISNLMTIYSVVTGKTIPAIQDEFADKGYGDFKGAVADATVEYLRPMRDRALELLKDEGELIRILNHGAEKARVLASKTLKDSYKALGILG
jgi:tryptophanyl-tRNA synthetase